jgi:hypothetical protein
LSPSQTAQAPLPLPEAGLDIEPSINWPGGGGMPGYRVDRPPPNYSQAQSDRGQRVPAAQPDGHIPRQARVADLPADEPWAAAAAAHIAAWPGLDGARGAPQAALPPCADPSQPMQASA